MKKNKIIVVIMLSIIMLSTTILNVFAYETNPTSVPSDLGIQINNLSRLSNTFYYIKIEVINNVDGNIFTINTMINGNVRYSMDFNNNKFVYTDYSYDNIYYLAKPLYFTTQSSSPYSYNYSSSISTYYFAFAIAGQNPIGIIIPDNDNFNVTVYSIDNYDMDYDYAYIQGYIGGYENGIIDAAGYQSDLNIVQHIEQLLSTFIGNEYASYVTPIALVLTILLIYFLFIRWLLSMIKAKGVLKVCDIIVLVACISILVVLYFPMIDITTTQHQIIENVYSVTSDITP